MLKKEKCIVKIEATKRDNANVVVALWATWKNCSCYIEVRG
jgi:hypothetical protein